MRRVCRLAYKGRLRAPGTNLANPIFLLPVLCVVTKRELGIGRRYASTVFD